MRALVAVLCVLSAVTASPLLGTEQCASGPSVWCVNIKTADQCGAVTHCQQTVWNKPVVKSVSCDVCKDVVTAASNFLKDNATQEEIKSFLEKVCEFVPNPSLTSECKLMIDQYLPLLINIIEEQLSDPSVACCAMGLCKSLQQHLASLKSPEQLLSNEIPDVDLSKLVSPFMSNVPLLLYPQEKTEQNDKDVCKDCLQLISDIQDNLKSNASFCKVLKDNAVKQCDQLAGSFSDLCKNYVEQYADLVCQGIIQVDQPAKTICCGSGLCPTETAAPQEVMPAKVLVPAVKLQPAVKVTEKTSENDSGLPVCELCTLIVEKLEKMLEENRTQAHIKEALEKVCLLVPSKYRGECTSFIDKYIGVLIELLESGSTCKVICMAMGLCSERPARIVKLDSGNAKFLNCEVCELMVKYMDRLLVKNSTQEQIKECLEKVCNYLPKSDFDECDSIIESYEPMIIQLLLQALEPHFVCEKIGVCQSQSAKKPLLGTEKCMWGPSYWCKDLETAGSCNAIEHCKRHVWN